MKCAICFRPIGVNTTCFSDLWRNSCDFLMISWKEINFFLGQVKNWLWEIQQKEKIMSSQEIKEITRKRITRSWNDLKMENTTFSLRHSLIVHYAEFSFSVCKSYTLFQNPDLQKTFEIAPLLLKKVILVINI